MEPVMDFILYIYATICHKIAKCVCIRGNLRNIFLYKYFNVFTKSSTTILKRDIFTPKTKSKLKRTLYILSPGEQVIHKTKKLVYCVKEESKFSKGISGDVISSKVSTYIPSLFHVETTLKRRFYEVYT